MSLQADFNNISGLLAELPNFEGSRWIIAGAFLFGWIVLLLVLKQILLWVLRRAGRRPHLRYLNTVLDAISPALAIIIVVVGVKIASQITPIDQKWQAEVNVALLSGMIAALIVFADRISRIWLRYQATRYPLFTEGYGIVNGAVRGVIIALGLLMFLESVGISIGPLLASLGIGSLAIALALQETFKNIFSGFFLIADKPLEVGDFVKLQSGQEGELFKLGWRSSKFRMLSGEVVVVPNSEIIDSILTNSRGADGYVAVSIDLAVLNVNDAAHVEQVTGEVARDLAASINRRMAEHDWQVMLVGITGNLLNITVLIRIPSSDGIAAARTEFIKRVLARYAAEQIKLPS